MKKYTFELIIHEGSDEFWDELSEKSGCDEITEFIKNLLEDEGWLYNGELRLVRFEGN